jgi:small-conductance mechanosensitive channel
VDEVSDHFFLIAFLLYAWYFVHCIEKMLPFLWILDVCRSIAHTFLMDVLYSDLKSIERLGLGSATSAMNRVQVFIDDTVAPGKER